MHNAAIIPTCVRAHNFVPSPVLTQVAMIAASCTPTASVLSWSVVVMVGVA